MVVISSNNGFRCKIIIIDSIFRRVNNKYRIVNLFFWDKSIMGIVTYQFKGAMGKR